MAVPCVTDDFPAKWEGSEGAGSVCDFMCQFGQMDFRNNFVITFAITRKGARGQAGALQSSSSRSVSVSVLKVKSEVSFGTAQRQQIPLFLILGLRD